VVIGLDSAPPELVFGHFAGDLSHLQGLMARGVWGPLRSVIPPITVPAWACAMTGRDPGELGIYGFRHRVDYRYEAWRWVDSTDVRHPAVWDWLAQADIPVILLGVPPAFPPRRVHGCQVGCFLTPDTRRSYTYPEALAQEIRHVVGDYALDVESFRAEQRSRLLVEISDMTRQRFRLFRHLLRTRPWGFAMMVEIGVDRMHHAFYGSWDQSHPRYLAGGPYQHALRDYYRLVDQEVGAVLAELDETTAVMVLSDHGVRRLHGGICLNEWLIREGYLTLKVVPTEPTRLTPGAVDWSRTRAWGEGGYCGRVWVNVRGRQPQGVVDPEDFPRLREELAAGLTAIEDDRGSPLATEVHRPDFVYRECHNAPPDLLVYFGGLDWRAVGAVGANSLHVAENDTGTDDANHDPRGMLILSAPGLAEGREVSGLQLIDTGPLVLSLLGRSENSPDMSLESAQRRRARVTQPR
jgi:predicted AlkP superfamily phosphohydrolase/phosphomutase